MHTPIAMTVLRSRKVLPTGQLKSPPKNLKKGVIEPTTPLQTLEPSREPTPISSSSTQMGDSLGLGRGNGLDDVPTPSSGPSRRRSLRLAAKSGFEDIAGNASTSSGSVKGTGVGSDGCCSKESSLGNTERKSVGDRKSCVPNVRTERVRVSERNKTKDRCLEGNEGTRSSAEELDLMLNETKVTVSGGNSGLGCDLGSSEQSREEATCKKRGRRKRKFSVEAGLPGLELVGEDALDRNVLNLRSGTKVVKTSVEGTGAVSMDVEIDDVYQLVDEVEADVKLGRRKDKSFNGEKSKGILMNEFKSDLANGEDGAYGFRGGRRLRGEAKDKGKLIGHVGTDKIELGLSLRVSSSVPVSEAAHLLEGVDIGESKKDMNSDDNGNGFNTRKRLSREEKGKAKAFENDPLSNVVVDLELGLASKFGSLFENAASDLINLAETDTQKEDTKVGETNSSANNVRLRRRDYKEQFRNIARQNASRFAHFSSHDEEENHVAFEREREVPKRVDEREMEDWPGPFSTAMKIIRDRALNANVLPQNSSLHKSKSASVIWVPKRGCESSWCSRMVPSLMELCFDVLARNADAITSLDNVPDALRHKLTQLLCDSRRMNNHFLELLVSGSPTEIRVMDCSWLSEEHFLKSFEGCDTSKLTVLQLDQCGRCLPDYILTPTLACLSNSLHALTTVSLKGACRLSDVGLRTLISSAPAVRSINLGQCSLLTSDGINCLADSLGSVLRELYIDDCQGVDAMRILPALSKLKHLEVLSIAGIHTVCDDFVSIFVADCGCNMKELILTDCMKLTDVSVKIISENCTQLCAIDLSNLRKLTDSAIGYLANGRHLLQKLKLCRNAFSDEAVAAYLETCGKSLKELSLNNINKVAHHTALSLSQNSRNLLSLDLSWCRNLTNEALGLIVDSCLSLKVLKLFGCTQITNVFLDGHSNSEVQMIGLKMTPILEHLNLLDPLQSLLH